MAGGGKLGKGRKYHIHFYFFLVSFLDQVVGESVFLFLGLPFPSFVFTHGFYLLYFLLFWGNFSRSPIFVEGWFLWSLGG